MRSLRNDLTTFLTATIALTSAVCAARTDADNSAMNARDGSATEVTAEQQGSSQADVAISRRIRKNVISDKDLSFYAKNIKIITNQGEVTIKGPVRSRAEADTIMNSARAVSGVSSVNNRMDIVLTQ